MSLAGKSLRNSKLTTIVMMAPDAGRKQPLSLHDREGVCEWRALSSSGMPKRAMLSW